MSWLDDAHQQKLQREQANRADQAEHEREEQAKSARDTAADPRLGINRQIEAYAASVDAMIRGSLTDMAGLTWGADKFQFVEHDTDRRTSEGATFVSESGAIVDLLRELGPTSMCPRSASWTVRGPLISTQVVSSRRGRGTTDRSYIYPYYRVGIGFGEDGAPTLLECGGGDGTIPPITEDGLREQLKAYYLAGPSTGEWATYSAAVGASRPATTLRGVADSARSDDTGAPSGYGVTDSSTSP